jgi:aspartyl-tRNA(Asn)/glutamyl-tRNA(Gln) amidotransferase subunit A
MTGGTGNPAFLSAAELLDAYAARALSPVEATRTILDRIDRIDPQLNSFLTVDHDGAIQAARAAERAWHQPGDKSLHCGVPVSIKDLIYTSWLPTTHGSLAFKDYRHPHNSIAVDRLLQAGAIVLGKTNTPEFGLIDITRNRIGPDGRNAWDQRYTCGGSSGGAGAAVAAGLGPLALGTDGAGSIRIPAFCNGIFGLKPTFGRIAHDGWKGSPYTSHLGPMTRTVRDAALMMQAVAGPHHGDAHSLPAAPPYFLQPSGTQSFAGSKIGFSIDYGYLKVDPEVRQAVLDAGGLLRSFGCETIESSPPRSNAFDLDFYGTAPEEYEYARSVLPDIGDRLDQLTDYGRPVIGAGMSALGWQYRTVTRQREEYAAALRDWFAPFDFFLAPVMAAMPPRWDAERHFDGDNPWPGLFLPPFNATGQPAAAVPFGFHSNGLPLAIQLVARYGDDVGLLQLCAAIESGRSWAHLWPPVAERSVASSASMPAEPIG